MTLTHQFVRTTVNGSILEIVLDRPKANAITTEVSKELAEVFFTFQDDPTLQVAIITGAGDHFFSGGFDLKAGEPIDADHGPGGFAGLTEIFDLYKPVIAAVNGLAVGGGFELALACDLIISCEDAAFFLPETSIGMVPDAGGILRLPKAIPRAVAMEMFYTNKRLTAEEAHHYGLVNKVVPYDSLMEEARTFAERIIESAPLSIAAIKEIIRHTAHLSVKEGYDIMKNGNLPMYESMLQSADALEGPKAFQEKRKPVWKGK